MANVPDVLGLKLGMTIEQAEARLKEIDPGIWLITGYATEDENTWADRTGVIPQIDAEGIKPAPFHDADIHVPVFVAAAKFGQLYAQPLGPYMRSGPVKEIKDKNTPIDQFTGEFFDLYFTPDDRGGRLYAIVRHKVYFSDASRSLKDYAASGVALPKRADLADAAIKTYGVPSIAENENQYTSLYWIYSRELRLSQRVGTLSPCESRLLGADASRKYDGTTPYPTWWSIKAGRNVNVKQIEVSLEDREFYKLTSDETVTSLYDNVSKLISIVPSMVTGPYQRRPRDTFQEEEFSQCGIALHAVIRATTQPDSEGLYATAVTISLSDQRATFFDNGVRAYMEQRVRAIGRPSIKAPPDEVFATGATNGAVASSKSSPPSFSPETVIPGAILTVTNGFAGALTWGHYWLLQSEPGAALRAAGLKLPTSKTPSEFMRTTCQESQPTCARITAALNAAGVVKAYGDAYGDGTFRAVPTGSYYLVISAVYEGVLIVRTQRIELKPGINSIALKP